MVVIKDFIIDNTKVFFIDDKGTKHALPLEINYLSVFQYLDGIKKFHDINIKHEATVLIRDLIKACIQDMIVRGAENPEALTQMVQLVSKDAVERQLNLNGKL